MLTFSTFLIALYTFGWEDLGPPIGGGRCTKKSSPLGPDVVQAHMRGERILLPRRCFLSGEPAAHGARLTFLTLLRGIHVGEVF